MKNISFALTTKQLLAGTKDVTRRLGWSNLRIGERLCAIEKGQGLRKGQKIKRLAIIEVVAVSREPLWKITAEECAREGFPGHGPIEFMEMFCKHNGCKSEDTITRIEFRIVEAKQS